MSIAVRKLYESANGDRWYLMREHHSGRVLVRHEPNLASGGDTAVFELGEFLMQQGPGPQHAALLNLIGTLVGDGAPRSHPSPDAPAMKLSARNQIKGKVTSVQKGQTTGHVRIDIGSGVVITASITNEAVDDLGLQAGDEAVAVIKASDVIVAK
jgi:molybdopterin-binding protein